MSKIDLNQADLETLSRLHGIGDTLAARIVEYRETVHPFAEVIELAAVPGISEQMVQDLADEITVEPATPAPEEEEGESEAESAVRPEEAATTEPEEALAEDEEETRPVEPDIVLLAETRIAEKGTSAEERSRQPEEEVPSVAEEPFAEEVAATAEVPAEAEPDEEAVQEAPPVPPPPAGSSCFGRLLTALWGALLGAGGTLLLLYLLNGTLDFASPAEVSRLQSQIAAQGEDQSGLSEEIVALSTQVSRAEAAEATAAAGLEEMRDDLADLETAVAGDVAALETETEVLATRVGGLSDAAENFDLFLDGMRDLLIELRGLPPLPTTTPTGTMTATPAGAEGTPSLTRTPTPTPTPVTTRTPRPTATPFVSPTVTAVNIP